VAKNDENGKGPTQCPQISQHTPTESGSTATIAKSYAGSILPLESQDLIHRPGRKELRPVVGQAGMTCLDVCGMGCGE
jgi:hypothetical protein